MNSEEDSTTPKKPSSDASSIEEAVNELLLITSKAVKKLTESKTRNSAATSEEESEDSMDQGPSKLKQDASDDLSAYEKDKRLLEILSETQQSNLDGRTVDITTALDQDKHSDVSILDVAGGQPDTYSSTPSTVSHEDAEKSRSASSDKNAALTVPKLMESELPGDSIFSPISLSPEMENLEKDDHDVDESFIQQSSEKNLTSSIKRKADHITLTSDQNSSGNSSSASEVLINSTRIPHAPFIRIVNAGKTDDNVAPDNSNLIPVKTSENEPSTQIIIRKSSHKEKPVLTESKGQQNATEARFADGQTSQQRVKIPKKRLREVKSPVEIPTQPIAMTANSDLNTKQNRNKSLSKGLMQGIETDGKENKNLGTDVNIITSSKEVAKRRLLEAKGKIRPIKQVIPVNMVRRDRAYPVKSRKSDPVSTAAAVASAIASTTPMLQVKHDLEAQVKRLTEKLDELEKQKQFETAAKHQEKVDELEKKLSELTAQRLCSLEQLQEQQAAWQSHFLRVVGNMQSTQKHLTKAVKTKRDQSPYGMQSRGVRFQPREDDDRNQNVLQTPAPRVQAPMPTRKHVKGMSPGQGRLLQNILDQWDVSTPGPSPAIPLKKNLHDPLADLTPVRGPSQHDENNFPQISNAVNLTTSTPQDVAADTRSVVRKARKEAEKEAERLEIVRRFPSSLSQYLSEPFDVRPVTTNLPIMPTKNDSSKKSSSSVDDLWKGLKELQQTRKYLDDNLAAVERGRSGESIADKVNLEIYMQHPDADPNLIERLRIRQMVDEQIEALRNQIKNEVTREQSYDTFVPKKNLTKAAGKGRLPKPTTGARVDTGLRKRIHEAKGGRGAKKGPDNKSGRRPRSASPQDRSIMHDTLCMEDENYVTHVYGKADYHPRRTTVHDPYIHMRTPVKQATFRKKQAVEIVKANLIRSAKTQTSPHTSQLSQYYFSPSNSPVHPPICVSPTPGQLIPMAIPLRPPRVCNATEPVPLIIEQREPRFVTLTTQSPKKEKKFRIYNPSSPEMQALERTKKPNAAVINVRGTDGLEVQKLPNVDIDTDVSQASMPDMPQPIIHDDGEIPGSMPLRRGDEDISQESEGTLEIELCGNAGNEPEVNYYGPEFPPAVPPPRTGFSTDQISQEIGRNELENEAIRWVEQEIMARILTELHPPGGMKIQDSGPVCDQDSEETAEDHDSVLLNPESLQLFVDAGLPIDATTVNHLVEEEISAILREMIRQFGQEQMAEPKESVQVPVSSYVPSFQIPTPLPTPRLSPASSIAEKPKSLHTPSITPESSMAESIASHEESPPPTPKIRLPSPKAASPPKSPDRTPVQTPEATPPSTPTPEPSRAATPALSESEKVAPPRTPPLQFPDPWGGTEFPLPEEVCGKKKTSGMTFAPPPDAIDLVVREVTPPPTSPHDRSELSDTETPTTSSSDDHGESSISEGQLVISHGEMRARTKPRRLPGIIEELFSEEDVERSIAFQSTLRDANELQNEEYEPCSDGEIRLSMRPSMIARVAGHDKHRKKQRSTFPKEPPGDDPVGVYARPRHPLPDIEDEEDISVGEVRPKTSNVARRNKFRQWREQRSLSQKSEPKRRQHEPGETFPSSPPLSMDDLSKEAKELESYKTDRSDDFSDSHMVQDENVIMVSSKKSEEKLFVPSSNKDQKSLLQYALPTMSTLERTGESTDQSFVPKDSLDESMNRPRTFKDFEEDVMDQVPLKVSLTLPSVEQSGASSEPVTDDISEISTGGL